MLAIARYWNWYVAMGALGASAAVALHLLAARLGHASMALGNELASEERKQSASKYPDIIKLAEHSAPDNTTCRIQIGWWIVPTSGCCGLLASFFALDARGELNLHPLTLVAVSFPGVLLGAAAGLIVSCLRFATASIVTEVRRY